MYANTWHKIFKKEKIQIENERKSFLARFMMVSK